MRSLEEITRDLFISYSQRKVGKKLQWSLLKKERQIDWLEDSYFLIEELIDLLEKELEIKELPKPNTSFESGVVTGVNRERRTLREKLLKIKRKYLTDLENKVNSDT